MRQPHEIEWSAEQITRFWDWMGARPSVQALYFSRTRGDAILDVARRYVNWREPVLDLGAGPGYLTEKLIARGAKVWAADTSPDSVAALARRLAGQKNFLGARVSTPEQVSLPDASVGTVFSVETVEHLDDDALRGLLHDVMRLLKPRGTVIITTPHAENLEPEQVMCPECGAVFHRTQHLRTWTRATLTETMQAFGFEPMVCKTTVFSLAPPLLRPLNYLALVWRGMPLPYLLYVGRKRD